VLVNSPRRGTMRPRVKAWHERDAVQRLARDRALIATRYPGLTHRIDEVTGRAFLEGILTLTADCGIPTRFDVRVEFPTDYPKMEPRAYDAAGRFPHTADRHFYPNGQCCLWLPPESRWDSINPDALNRFLDEVAIFFDRQLVYEATGRREWPGGQRSHGDAGYLEYVIDFFDGNQALVAALVPILASVSDVERNSRCLCGSGRKYKHCHLRAVETLRRRVGSAKLCDLFRHLVRNANVRQPNMSGQ